MDIDQNLVGDPTNSGIRSSVLEHMNYIASWTGTDIFFLKPKSVDIETASFNGTVDNTLDQRYRIAIFGDMESSEHAKTRILIMIDQIVGYDPSMCHVETTYSSFLLVKTQSRHLQARAFDAHDDLWSITMAH